MERQLLKLHDVLELRHRTDIDPAAFSGAAALMGVSYAGSIP